MVRFWCTTLGCLLIVGGCATGPYQAPAQEQQQRRQALERSDNLIVPGERIGPIRLGMFMDQVEALLGPRDAGVKNLNGVVTQWSYFSLNLVVDFDAIAAQRVISVGTELYTKKSTTYGDERWSDVYPVTTVFVLNNGIGLGATSFDVQRAYSRNYATNGTDIFMEYDHLGLSFRVTRDHRVVDIGVFSPR